MKRKFKLFQGVVLLRDIDDPCIKKGTGGVVMELLIRDGVAVEFFNDEGDTIDVALIPESYLRPETAEEAEETRALTTRLNARS